MRGCLTASYTGGQERSSWAQSSRRGRHTHPQFLLYLPALPLCHLKCFLFIIHRVPWPNRHRQHIGHFSHTVPTIMDSSHRHITVLGPFSECLSTPGVSKAEADKFLEKMLFLFQPDKHSHQTELADQAKGALSSG